MKVISDGKSPKQIADSYNNTIDSSKEKNDILSREADNHTMIIKSELPRYQTNISIKIRNVEVTTSDDSMDKFFTY